MHEVKSALFVLDAKWISVRMMTGPLSWTALAGWQQLLLQNTS